MAEESTHRSPEDRAADADANADAGAGANAAADADADADTNAGAGANADADAEARRRRHRIRRPGVVAVGLVVLLGALVGLGSFTFGYGEGFSYMSTRPEACINCHVMQPYYDSWLGGSHHHVASCVDCHLPHDFPMKYVSKADNGFFHSLAFTLENFHEPIQIKPRNARILQNACERCHADMVHMITHPLPGGVTPTEDGVPGSAGEQVDCIHCHQHVGHGPS